MGCFKCSLENSAIQRGQRSRLYSIRTLRWAFSLFHSSFEPFFLFCSLIALNHLHGKSAVFFSSSLWFYACLFAHSTNGYLCLVLCMACHISIRLTHLSEHVCSFHQQYGLDAVDSVNGLMDKVLKLYMGNSMSGIFAIIAVISFQSVYRISDRLVSYAKDTATENQFEFNRNDLFSNRITFQCENVSQLHSNVMETIVSHYIAYNHGALTIVSNYINVFFLKLPSYRCYDRSK